MHQKFRKRLVFVRVSPNRMGIRWQVRTKRTANSAEDTSSDESEWGHLFRPRNENRNEGPNIRARLSRAWARFASGARQCSGYFMGVSYWRMMNTTNATNLSKICFGNRLSSALLCRCGVARWWTLVDGFARSNRTLVVFILSSQYWKLHWWQQWKWNGIERAAVIVNPFTPELKKCILPTFQKAIVWVM